MQRTFYRIAILILLSISASAQVPAEYFSALQWRLIGPFRSSRSVAAVGVPSQPNTYFFGSVGGGVFKSTNSGLTWNPVFDGQPIGSIGAIAVAPSNPNIIYVGTGESDTRSALSSGDGVYKSTDGGQSWKNVGLRDTRQISRVIVDPTNPDTVYVAALGHAYGPNDERGIFKSTDGGTTWKRVLDKGPNIGSSDLALATANPNVLFAGMWNAHRPPWSTYAAIDGPGSGLYRSIDAGSTWTELKGNGLPDGEYGRIGVTVSPDGKRVYALIAVQHEMLKRDQEKKSGFYRSDDGGNTWTMMSNDPRLTSRAWYFNWLTVDPSNPDVVYVPNVALYRTENGGKTFTIVRGAPGGDDYHDLWVDPKNPNRLILAVDQGASVSVDRGATWSSWFNQPIGQMYHVTTDNRFPYIVYGAQQDSGSIAVASRTDHGIIGAQDWVNVGGGESGQIAVDPNDNDILYATSAGGGVSRYDRKTSLSQNVSPWPFPSWGTEINERKYRGPWTPPLVFSPADKKALYFGTQYVMKTLDGGIHWQTISPDLTGAKQGVTTDKPTKENATAAGFGVVYTLAPSPLKADQIWAGTDTGLIHLTTDGGKTWRNVTPAGIRDWSRVSMIEASRFDAGEAYAAVDCHRLDDQRPYIYRTRDYGKTWQPIVIGIGDHAFFRSIREDVKKRGLLFAGTELGVYVSFDDGDHWQPLQLNLPVTPVYDLNIHEDDLVVATHGRAFWILDNISPLREAATQSASTKSFLFAPANAIRVDNDSFLGTPLPPEEPQAKNPPDGAIFDYFLNADSGDITLEVFDSANQLVRRYRSSEKPPAKRKPLPIAERWFPAPQLLEASRGMHRFVWDLRWSASGENGDEDLDESAAPKGPRVIPGTYTVKLTVNGETTTRKLTVTMDPRSTATPAVLAEQLRLGREIYANTLLSRKAVAEADSIKKQLDDLKTTKPALAGRIDSFLNNMRKVTKGDRANWGLDNANSGLLAALRVVEGGNRTTPAATIELYNQSRQAFSSRAQQWQEFKTSEIPKLNQDLQSGGAEPIRISEIEEEIDYLMTR